MPGLSGMPGLSVAPFGGSGYISKVLEYAPFAYWVSTETSGTVVYCQINVAQNGVYVGNPGLGQPGIGDGGSSVFYNGNGLAYANVFTPTFANAFNGAEGTILQWGRVYNSGVWLDGISRRMILVRADDNNYVQTGKGAGNQIQWAYRAGGAAVAWVLSVTPLDFYQVAITWSASANQVKVYYSGVQVAPTQAIPGVWVGLPTGANIGVSTIIGVNGWNGYIAHTAFWNRALIPSDILDLAIVP